MQTNLFLNFKKSVHFFRKILAELDGTISDRSRCLGSFVLIAHQLMNANSSSNGGGRKNTTTAQKHSSYSREERSTLSCRTQNEKVICFLELLVKAKIFLPLADGVGCFV